MLRHNTGLNALEAAKQRMRFIFEEFDGGPVGVSTSGGKDSTVVFELARIVAKEMGIKKFPLLWLDQECEYESTVKYVEWQMNQPEVEPVWLQIPFNLSNATSHTEDYLHVWDPSNPGDMDDGGAWMRSKQPRIEDVKAGLVEGVGSYHDNVYGTDRFHNLLNEVSHVHFRGGATMTGMRTEESPNRRTAMTTSPNYKWITWGLVEPPDLKRRREQDDWASVLKGGSILHARFAPIYDWTWRDVWKAIHEHGWRYNTHYDQMYRYGVTTKNMRVSNYHHETAVWSLFQLQEIEPKTYAKATQRLEGIHTYGHLGADDFRKHDLPFMFDNWLEYRDYLIEKLCTPDKAAIFHRRFATTRRNYPLAIEVMGDRIAAAEAKAVIENDWEFVKYQANCLGRIPPDLKRGPEHEARKKELNDGWKAEQHEKWKAEQARLREAANG